ADPPSVISRQFVRPSSIRDFPISTESAVWLRSHPCLSHTAAGSSHSFVEKPPRTPQESHHLVLHLIHGFEARADAGGLRDGKETEVIVSCKHDSLPVLLPVQDQAKECLEL